MKFLCVKCDTAMSLLGTQMYEDQGSIAVRYGCPKCPAEIAMLTNRAETQVVTSLGVQIGPQHDRQAPGSAGQTEPPPVSKCPFGAMLQTGQESSAFGAVSAAIRQPDGGVHWSADASERLERVPGVVRQMARMGIEQYARDNGHAEVTVPVLDAAKAQFGFLMKRPYVISWNLTYRCNLACEHCYLDAGAKKFQKLTTPDFRDRSELSTEECYRVIDQIAAFAPESVTILTGGEPLLRRDILEIIRYGVSKKLWVVVGTNGVLVTETLAEQLKAAGVRGFALSLDALEPARHDAFRVVKGAWQNTVDGAKILAAADFPFIIQTTVGSHNINEIGKIADFAHAALGAKVWNLYFLVQTGRGQFVSDISHAEYEGVLAELSQVQRKYHNKMMVNAKCAPHYARTLFENDPESPFLKTFSRDAGGCPAGSHYLGIRPNGDMTPCPYLPVFGGNLRSKSFQQIFQDSELFNSIRQRSLLGGRCGACEFAGVCGGCRARAYGVSGSFLDEDPLCAYIPGRYERSEVESRFRIIYGQDDEAPASVTWDDAARTRLEKIPAFVRGTVIKAVETYCQKNGIAHVSIERLEQIKSKMPMQRVFSGAQKMSE